MATTPRTRDHAMNVRVGRCRKAIFPPGKLAPHKTGVSRSTSPAPELFVPRPRTARTIPQPVRQALEGTGYHQFMLRSMCAVGQRTTPAYNCRTVKDTFYI